MDEETVICHCCLAECDEEEGQFTGLFEFVCFRCRPYPPPADSGEKE